MQVMLLLLLLLHLLNAKEHLTLFSSPVAALPCPAVLRPAGVGFLGYAALLGYARAS
jgi:hypothetical protein